MNTKPRDKTQAQHCKEIAHLSWESKVKKYGLERARKLMSRQMKAYWRAKRAENRAILTDFNRSDSN